MKSTSRRLTFATLAFGLLLSLLPAQSHAIPAWARKYKMDCTNCHFGSTNRLTKFGKDFQMRGFRTADEEVASDLGQINVSDYMSFAGKVRYTASKEENPSTKFDVEALSLYFGGPLYRGFGLFFEFYLHERGKESTTTGGQLDTTTRSKMAEAYLQYTSTQDPDKYWFARAGSFTPRIIHTASTGGRVSVSRPLTWNNNVGGGNLFTPRDRFYGVTAGYRAKGGVTAEVGLTNGGGTNARPNLEEQDNMKDVFGSLEYEFDPWGSQLGIFAYKGAFSVTGNTPFKDDFTSMALIGSFVRDNFELSGAYGWGRNTLAAGGHRNPKSFYLEGAMILNPNVTLFARYDSFDPDLAAKTTGGAFGLSYRLNHIGRVVFEGTSYKQAGQKTKNGLMIELNWMF